MAVVRTADPYDDTDVIDARGPRTNQAVIGALALVGALTGQAWLWGLLALQLAIGLTLGRRWCLPCLLYFEVIQPRFGEGPIEDARPPRFANLVGLVFLAGATVLHYARLETAGTVLGSIVAALALLAATTGFCTGCQAYRLAARLRGVAARHVTRIDPGGRSPTGDRRERGRPLHPPPLLRVPGLGATAATRAAGSRRRGRQQAAAPGGKVRDRGRADGCLHSGGRDRPASACALAST
jgi:Domain of unknown function (DUF4395)